ncbi:DUF1896 domain-containing protein [Bacteroides ovatus]|uniref:DUF1896 domain-containing protein n=1 Tax=Bacteroides ovatus TaxID=28116 RepID=UPI0020A70E58|nr:DUF1896 domain-containing protein [Bacteroides ovatus]CAG9877148.1 hypothetical protein BOVA115_1189 [Bacteroides ovatus]
MIIQDKNTATGELSYFETTLLLYLKESHPHIADDKALVRARTDEAAGSYECAMRDGLSVTQALQLAEAVLYQGLRFSRFDTVFEVVSEWFPEVQPEKRAGFCLKVLSPAETVFSKYPIDDRFESSPSYHTLTVELTGFIQFYIEQYGI